jgi:hypothetical protein
MQGFRQTRLRAYVGAWVRRLGVYILAAFTRGWAHGAVCVGSFVSCWYLQNFKPRIGAYLIRLGAFIFAGETPEMVNQHMNVPK